MLKRIGLGLIRSCSSFDWIILSLAHSFLERDKHGLDTRGLHRPNFANPNLTQAGEAGDISAKNRFFKFFPKIDESGIIQSGAFIVLFANENEVFGESRQCSSSRPES